MLTAVIDANKDAAKAADVGATNMYPPLFAVKHTDKKVFTVPSEAVELAMNAPAVDTGVDVSALAIKREGAFDMKSPAKARHV